MDMRLRLPELLEEHELTAYEVAKRSGGRILPSTLYRIVRDEGRVKLFAADMVEALCDILGAGIMGVGPGKLFERDGESAPPEKAPARKAARKRVA
jgi:hypothetical protein